MILKKIVGDEDGIRQKGTGSRYDDGNVPNVNFNPNTGKVNVNNYHPDNHNDNLRSRQKFQKEKSASAGFLLCILSSRWSFWKFLLDQRIIQYIFSAR